MADIVVTVDEVGFSDFIQNEIIPLQAVEIITKGQACYQTTAGKAGIADANVVGKQQARGIALNDAQIGQTVDLLKRGAASGFVVSALDSDVQLFLSDNPGAIADTASVTLTVVVGRVFALTDSDLTELILFDFDWLRNWV